MSAGFLPFLSNGGGFLQIMEDNKQDIVAALGQIFKDLLEGTQSWDYARKNGMEPNDTIRTVAESMTTLLEFSTFNHWGEGKEDSHEPEES